MMGFKIKVMCILILLFIAGESLVGQDLEKVDFGDQVKADAAYYEDDKGNLYTRAVLVRFNRYLFEQDINGKKVGLEKINSEFNELRNRLQKFEMEVEFLTCLL